MASVLKVNTLTGVTTAGSIVVTGEGNSTTTNLQQGLAKASCLFDQTAPAIDASFNTASLTDTSAGKGIVNWTNNMGGALTYSCTTGITNGNNNHPYLNAILADKLHVTQTTSAFPFRSGYAGFENGSANNPFGNFADNDGCLVVAFGDLA
tara:strand:+ start:342 stop:794 length:453 start_codon:yes stop_codon:yes gene_type:complete